MIEIFRNVFNFVKIYKDEKKNPAALYCEKGYLYIFVC